METLTTIDLPCPECGGQNGHVVTVTVGQVVQLLFVKFAHEIHTVN